MKHLPPPRVVDTDDGLRQLAKDLETARALAVDTEADSFHHYREKVCLIQITAAEADYIVDPLAVTDLEPLRPLFEDPSRLKIFHDAGYDLIGLGRDYGFVFAGLFDTMLASRLLGVKSFGLAAILSERYGFEADKRLQRSDWAQRPLTDEQLDYARSDTHFLPRLADELRSELKARGRWEWAQEDFQRLPEIAARVSAREPGGDPEAWWRIKGVKQLPANQRGRARALYAARDEIARRLDRPPFKVFGDAVIIDLARHPPTDLDDLRPRRGLRRAGVERFGAQIMAALENAEPVKERPPPGSGRRRRTGRLLDPDARNRYEKLRNLRRAKAAELGIDPEIAIANATLEDLARQSSARAPSLEDVPHLNGWRRELFGADILAALVGPER